ncbi:MAG: type II toxin-antitoxin system HicA family toxin [Chloroflexi bacterium]|nr:type II toxin-antitoxin system HicA family toxin [Chloroflexota bacterium]
MGRLRVLWGRKYAESLPSIEFTQVRQKGSHIIMQRQSGESSVTVPVPNHRELADGTLLSIIRQSQLSRELFEEKG